MSYFAKNNYIKYDEWFDENISPLDLKFYLLSTSKIFIGGSEKLINI